MDKKNRIACRVAKEFTNNSVVNLGIGIPTLIPQYVPSDIQLAIHSENGALGVDFSSEEKEEVLGLTDAGGRPIHLKTGGMVFDSAYSFGIIRSGILDFTVLGALEVDRVGNLSNWIVPGKIVPGMGGAMDLLYGAKKVIVAMEHTNKKGQSKIVKSCTLPLTGSRVVHQIVTELAVFSIENEQLILEEIMPGSSYEEIKAVTEAPFICRNEKVKEGVANV